MGSWGWWIRRGKGADPRLTPRARWGGEGLGGVFGVFEIRGVLGVFIGFEAWDGVCGGSFAGDFPGCGLGVGAGVDHGAFAAVVLGDASEGSKHGDDDECGEDDEDAAEGEEEGEGGAEGGLWVGVLGGGGGLEEGEDGLVGAHNPEDSMNLGGCSRRGGVEGGMWWAAQSGR